MSTIIELWGGQQFFLPHHNITSSHTITSQCDGNVHAKKNKLYFHFQKSFLHLSLKSTYACIFICLKKCLQCLFIEQIHAPLIPEAAFCDKSTEVAFLLLHKLLLVCAIVRGTYGSYLLHCCYED